MQRMVQIDEGSRDNTTSIDEDAVYGLGDQSLAYTSGPSYHSTTCSSRNDLTQLKDEVRHKVQEEVDTKVKVLQDQLDEVKALLRALAQATQVSSSATTPHVNDPPTDDPPQMLHPLVISKHFYCLTFLVYFV